MRYRGLIHFHSKYSYDSILSIRKIVKFALNNNLNFLALTDHDSIVGSLKLKDFLGKRGINSIEVMLGAEYKTEYGDIIALGIEREIRFTNFDELVSEVRKQRGILLLPHPYRGHRNLEYVTSKVDMIEVFNSRISDRDNDKALVLAKKYGKPVYYATDAHMSISLGNCIVEFDNLGGLKSSILASNITPCKLKKSFFLEIMFSQLVKSIKTKDIKIFAKLVLQFLKAAFALKILKRV